jgi:hypothetical protein
MLTYEQRRDMICTHAWKIWTNNGSGMDQDMREDTAKSVNDAVANTYVEDIDDMDWLAHTLQSLGVAYRY